ncbi:MAG: CDP-archaeol synthase [Candidatus Peregrinibacteria bacterium]|nr:CDP-archaeol synthase [Candidatus Peregrinibacteria bacterium]
METPLIALLQELLIAYAPVYIANLLPPVAQRLALPGGKPIAMRLLGPHKTYRGLVSGTLGGILASAGLWLLSAGWYSNASLTRALALGFLLGFGAMAGDACKSLVKRQCGIRPGAPFPPWDQWDFLLGGTALGIFVYPFTWQVFLLALFLTPFLHLMTNVLAYHLKLKNVWW